MRVSKVILGALTAGAFAAVGIAGCGSSTTAATGATTTGSGSGTSSGFPCSPMATCTAADKECIGLVDNTGKTKFGLRMSELDISSPPALASGLINSIIGPSVYPNIAACNLHGTADFNWLLQFDTTAGTLKTGGAKPVMDPTKGYAFDQETLMQGCGVASPTMCMIAPITLMAKPDAMGNFSVMTGQNLIVPIYLDNTGNSVVLLPLQQARLLMGTLSSNNNCIGTYNAMGLDPGANCMPDSTHPEFNDAGKLDGFVSLEDADTVIVSQLSESLCVLLSGDATMYGNGASPNKCKRDASMKILYQGGWCSTTNMAAGAGCADAEHLVAGFAASSVLITN